MPSQVLVAYLLPQISVNIQDTNRWDKSVLYKVDFINLACSITLAWASLDLEAIMVFVGNFYTGTWGSRCMRNHRRNS